MELVGDLRHRVLESGINFGGAGREEIALHLLALVVRPAPDVRDDYKVLR